MNYLSLLGHKVEDAVTGFSGVVTSVSYDLYGCIQALVHPGLDEQGDVRNTCWFDTNRLVVKSDTPVIVQPAFVHEKGPENKPSMGKP